MNKISRRSFVKSATLATGAIASFGAMSCQAQGMDKSKIKLGLIGCGGRGKGALGNFLEAAKTLEIEVEIVAIADVFQDRVEGVLSKFKIDAKRGHAGYTAYKKVADSDAEIVIMATPPSFRPLHFDLCVEAGKHCFIEKPIAVDPVGARQVIASGEKAKAKGLTVVAGTQRRYDQKFLETKATLDAGAIGEIVGGIISWNGNVPWISPRQPGQSDAHYITRNWLNFTELSGDHIVEQHVHQYDVANWFMGRPPISFIGMGGRARRETGNQFDFFSVDLDYGEGIHIHSQCRQLAGCYNRVGESFRGTEGHTTGAKIQGNEVTIDPIVQEHKNGMIQEHVELIKSARDRGRKEPLNCAQAVAEATLCAIGSRISAYTGKLVRWVDITENTKSPFYAMQLTPSPLDFETGHVVMPEEVPTVPGEVTEFRVRA